MESRKLALEILRKARAGRTFVDELLDAASPAGMSSRDHGLLTGIVFGATRHRRTLDALIEKYAARSIRRIHPDVVAILQLTLVQLLFMERIPEYAACNDAVNLAKSVSARSASFVNAVVRAMLRDIDKRKIYAHAESDRELEVSEGVGVRFKTDWLKARDPIGRIGLRYSYPNLLVRRWIEHFGAERAEEICRAGNRRLPLTGRVNLRKATREAVLDHLGAESVKARKGAHRCSIILEEVGSVASLKTFQAGEFSIQDETSIRIGLESGIEGSPLVLDLCASPGGKASHLAELAPTATIIANDVSVRRAERLDQTRRRLGCENLHVMAGDGCRAGFRRGFDLILLDAPCSNSGVLARRPDARWRITEPELSRLTRLQSRLMAGAGGLLKKGGRLIYSTCSIEPEENEQVLQRFLQNHPEMRMETSWVAMPGSNAGGGFFARITWPTD